MFELGQQQLKSAHEEISQLKESLNEVCMTS